MLTKEELPECPVATTVALIGSKWKLLIIRNLLQRRDQPEGADRQSAFHGRGRTDHPDGLSGGSAQSGICIKRPWKILKTDPGFYGRVGQFI